MIWVEALIFISVCIYEAIVKIYDSLHCGRQACLFPKSPQSGKVFCKYKKGVEIQTFFLKKKKG